MTKPVFLKRLTIELSSLFYHANVCLLCEFFVIFVKCQHVFISYLCIYLDILVVDWLVKLCDFPAYVLVKFWPHNKVATKVNDMWLTIVTTSCLQGGAHFY